MQATDALPDPASCELAPAPRLFGPAGFFGASPRDSQPRVADLLRDALRVIRSHFGMDVAFISEFRDGRRIFRYVDADAAACPMREGDSDPLEDSYCLRIVDGRLPPVVQDTAACPETARLPATAALPVGSCLGVPIRFSGGELYGTFCCFSANPDRTLNTRDAQTMRVFSEFVAGVMESHAATTSSRRQSEERLRRMLEERDFTIVYQPIVSIARHKVVGYEALTRFNGEPQLSPEVWFKEAAAVGLLEELEVAVLGKALEALPGMRSPLTLSLNVSPSTVLEGRLGPLLRGQPLKRLVLEVTEHASVSDYDALAARLEPLRAAGLRLAVDDAGAGFASFRHILKIRPDDIKLDISLIRKIDRDLGARALAAALIRFARETRSKIVAEGVETESVLQVLRQLGVDKVQGFLIGRPGPLPSAASAAGTRAR